MKILIYEKHVGMAMANASLLRNIGHEVHIILNVHNSRYIDLWGFDLGKTDSVEYLEAKNRLNEISRYGIIDIIDNNIKLDKSPIYDVVLTSFPPTNIVFLEACNLGKINHVNLANKFDIHCSNVVSSTSIDVSANAASIQDRLKIHDYFINTKNLITSCTMFDKEYFKYYTNRDVQYIKFFPFHAHNIFSNTYEENLVGIFPLHSFYLKTNTEIAKKITSLGAKNNLKFVYKNNNEGAISHDLLSKTMFNIILPYNYFSVSSSEAEVLSPSIYPSDNFIVDNQLINEDWAIYPNYVNYENSAIFDKTVSVFGEVSPQSYEPENQMHWLKFAEYRSSENRFDNVDEIFDTISSMDFKYAREKRKEQNDLALIGLQEKWAKLYEDNKNSL